MISRRAAAGLASILNRQGTDPEAARDIGKISSQDHKQDT